MFKSIKLINFQSHIDSQIDLTSGINLITGSSDHGKSSILRAIKWVVENRPTRTSGFRNDQVDEKAEYSASIELTNEISITRFKNNLNNTLVNGYRIISTKDNTTTELKAVDADVPTEVSDILHMSEVSIQEQHNPYFLLNDKPGAVAAAFNAMIGLSVMDLCVGEAKKLAGSCKSNLKVLDTELIRINKELSNITDISILVQALQTLEKLDTNIEELEIDLSNRSLLISKYNECLTVIEYITPLAKSLCNILTVIEKTYKRLELCQNKFDIMTNVLNTYNKTEEIINSIRDNTPSINIDALENMYSEFTILQTSYKKAVTIENTFNDTYTELLTVTKQLDKKQKEYSLLFADYTECPFCGSILTK